MKTVVIQALKAITSKEILDDIKFTHPGRCHFVDSVVADKNNEFTNLDYEELYQTTSDVIFTIE